MDSKTSAFTSSIRLYPKQWERIAAVRFFLEERDGGPKSLTDVILYLLDLVPSNVAEFTAKKKPNRSVSA